jgi:hypothetical protein
MDHATHIYDVQIQDHKHRRSDLRLRPVHLKAVALEDHLCARSMRDPLDDRLYMSGVDGGLGNEDIVCER